MRVVLRKSGDQLRDFADSPAHSHFVSSCLQWSFNAERRCRWQKFVVYWLDATTTRDTKRPLLDNSLVPNHISPFSRVPFRRSLRASASEEGFSGEQRVGAVTTHSSRGLFARGCSHCPPTATPPIRYSVPLKTVQPCGGYIRAALRQ